MGQCTSSTSKDANHVQVEPNGSSNGSNSLHKDSTKTVSSDSNGGLTLVKSRSLPVVDIAPQTLSMVLSSTPILARRMSLVNGSTSKLSSKVPKRVSLVAPDIPLHCNNPGVHSVTDMRTPVILGRRASFTPATSTPSSSRATPKLTSSLRGIIPSLNTALNPLIEHGDGSTTANLHGLTPMAGVAANTADSSANISSIPLIKQDMSGHTSFPHGLHTPSSAPKTNVDGLKLDISGHTSFSRSLHLAGTAAKASGIVPTSINSSHAHSLSTSWVKLMRAGVKLSAVVDRFYVFLFAKSPRAAFLFRNTDMKHQKHIFGHIWKGLLTMCYLSQEQHRIAVEELAVIHFRYGVDATLWRSSSEFMFEAFNAVAQEHASPSFWTEQEQESWMEYINKTFNFGAERCLQVKGGGEHMMERGLNTAIAPTASIKSRNLNIESRGDSSSQKYNATYDDSQIHSHLHHEVSEHPINEDIHHPHNHISPLSVEHRKTSLSIDQSHLHKSHDHIDTPPIASHRRRKSSGVVGHRSEKIMDMKSSENRIQDDNQ